MYKILTLTLKNYTNQDEWDIIYSTSLNNAYNRHSFHFEILWGIFRYFRYFFKSKYIHFKILFVKGISFNINKSAMQMIQFLINLLIHRSIFSSTDVYSRIQCNFVFSYSTCAYALYIWSKRKSVNKMLNMYENYDYYLMINARNFIIIFYVNICHCKKE